MVTYVVPVLATVLGATVLHEPVHWFQPVGMTVVLAGGAMSTGRLTPRRRAPAS